MFRRSTIALLTLAGALAGCSTVNPTTAARLSTLSPLTTDPAQIQLALALPPGVGVQPGSARLTLAATRSDTQETQSQSVALNAQPTGDGMVVYSVAARDQPALRARQQAIRDWKERAPDAVKGSLSVTLTGCRKGDGPAPDARASILVRLAAGGKFLPLVGDMPLTQILTQNDLAAMGPCDHEKIPAED